MKTLLQTLFFFLLITQICLAQWYQQNSGTTVNLNAVQFMDANNGFVFGDAGTILHTNDGGATWTPQSSGTQLPLNAIYFVDDLNGWIVGGHYDGSNRNSVILHTSDGGLSWITQITLPSIWLIDVCFLDTNNGFAAGDAEDSTGWHSALLKTTNGGLSWTQEYDTLRHITRIQFVDSNTGWILVSVWGMGGGSQNVYKTEDAGTSWSLKLQTWETIHGQGPPLVFDIHFLDSSNGVAIGEAVYRTTDGGNTWIDTLVLAQGRGYKVSFVGVVTGTAVGESIYQTTDGGLTWNPQASGTTNALNGVYFIDNLNGWVVGDNGTILRTTNGGNPVPVELNSFTATANGKEVTLSWSTATELNNQGFEVQRKLGSNDFVTVGSVKGHGTSTSPNNYTYIDKITDAGKYFYRLKQIDFGGKFEYSQVVEVNWSPFTTYKLEQNYPNPFNPTTTLGFGIPASPNPSEGGALVTLKVYDILGNEVKTLVNKEMEAGYHSIDFNASDLPSGVYFYQLKAGSFIETKKMILLR